MENQSQPQYAPFKLAYVQRILYESATNSHLEQHLPSVLEDVAGMGYLSSEDTPAVQESINTEIEFGRRLAPLAEAVENGENITLETLREHGISLPALYDNMIATVSFADTLTSLAYTASEQFRKYLKKEAPASELPLVDYLQQRGHVPHETYLMYAGVALRMLSDVEASLKIATKVITSVLPQNLQEVNEFDSKKLKEQWSNLKLYKDGTIQLHSVEGLLLGLGRPGIPIKESLAQFEISKIVRIYNTWQKCKRSIHFETLFAPGMEDLAPPEQELQLPSAEEYQTQIDQLVTEHEQSVAAFRTPSSQLKKAGFRDLDNALVRYGQTAPDTRIVTGEDARRLIGVLLQLERLGSDPDKAKAAFYAVLPGERVIMTHFEQLPQEAKNRQLHLDLSRWQPLKPDLEMLQRHWQTLRSILGDKWPNNRGKQASETIAHVLDAYKNYVFEHSNAEARLIGIAHRLGSIAMPPSTRPEAASMVMRQRVAKSTLEGIASGTEYTTSTRQRSEILLQYMELANSQHQPDDDELFGVLHISDPLPQSGVRYFSLRFRAPDGKEWALLESLRPELATYAVPMEVASAYSSLQDFIADFNKEEQRTLGTRKIIHMRDWTVDSHMQRIFSKITSNE